MSFVERSLAWFLRSTVVRGFSILRDSKFLFYSLITLTWVILAPVSLLLHNYLGIEVVNIVLKGEIAIIIAFLIAGAVINFVASTKVRILVTSMILVGIFSLTFFVIPVEMQFFFPVVGSIIFAGIICVSLFISIRSFNTSWVCRIMMVGKSPRKLFMHNVAICINIVSIIAPIFLLIRYLLGLAFLDLILAVVGFAAWGVVLYATTHFPEHFAYDIFASILSATYLIAVISFVMYVGTPLFVIILDIVFLIFGMSAAVQILHSRRKLEKVSVHIPQTTRSPEDSSIIIIQDGEEENLPDTPMMDEAEYLIEQETTEVRANYDGLIVILLGLLLCFHFILLQFLGELLIGPGFIPLPLQFTIVEYHFALGLIGYCLSIAMYLAFKVSLRFRGYTTKTMSEQAAFVKFLSLIDEEERKEFLQRIGKTVRDILVGGLMDLIETQRRRWEEGLEKGREFLRKIFRRDKEAEDI